jgi:hypothetical protein
MEAKNNGLVILSIGQTLTLVISVFVLSLECRCSSSHTD